jgi:hypothetical protein
VDNVATIVGVITTCITAGGSHGGVGRPNALRVAGAVLFPFVDCIIHIALPKMVTDTMRTYLVIMMYIWAFAGPAHNIEVNVRDTLVAVECVQNLVIADVKQVRHLRARTVFKDGINELCCRRPNIRSRICRKT